MKDVGLAAATLQPQDHLYEAGHLSHQFGSASETAQILSIEHLLRAEHNLGHAIDHVDDIDVMHIARTDDEKDHRDDKIYQYSVRDTDSEKVGSDSDNDLATAGGHLKQGIQDTNADTQNKKRHHSLSRLIQHLNEQELYNDRIDAMVESIRELNKDIKEIDEAVDLIDHGDLDESTAVGRANVKRIRSTMQAQGLDVDDPKYTRPDGSFNAEQARQDLIELREQKQEQVIQETKELENATRDREITSFSAETKSLHRDADELAQAVRANPEYNEAEIDYDATFLATSKAQTNDNDNVIHLASSTNTGADSLMLDDIFGAEQDVILTAEAPADTADDLMLDDIFGIEQTTTTDYTATSDNNVQYLETRTATSFAAADDDETENTISATFAQASSPDAATPATEEHTQEQDIVYTAEVSNNNGMGLG